MHISKLHMFSFIFSFFFLSGIHFNNIPLLLMLMFCSCAGISKAQSSFDIAYSNGLEDKHPEGELWTLIDFEHNKTILVTTQYRESSVYEPKTKITDIKSSIDGFLAIKGNYKFGKDIKIVKTRKVYDDILSEEKYNTAVSLLLNNPYNSNFEKDEQILLKSKEGNIDFLVIEASNKPFGNFYIVGLCNGDAKILTEPHTGKVYPFRLGGKLYLFTKFSPDKYNLRKNKYRLYEVTSNGFVEIMDKFIFFATGTYSY